MPKLRVHKIEIWCKEPVLFAKINKKYLCIVGRYYYYHFTQIKQIILFTLLYTLVLTE